MMNNTQYNDTQYTEPVPQKKGSGVAIAAFVCGIIGALVARIPVLGFIGWPLCLAALILGIIALAKNQVKWMSLVAILLSFTPLFAFLVMTIFFAGTFISTVSTTMGPSMRMAVNLHELAPQDSEVYEYIMESEEQADAVEEYVNATVLSGEDFSIDIHYDIDQELDTKSLSIGLDGLVSEEYDIPSGRAQIAEAMQKYVAQQK